MIRLAYGDTMNLFIHLFYFLIFLFLLLLLGFLLFFILFIFCLASQKLGSYNVLPHKFREL